ncbi:class A beta-lactamase [Phytoactinopolyspora limicola]|uniref:class A beta-lactamase n=1 Tax=Phytoactinopolyspora limicola TaxID=2715536 RepID=UPI00140B54BF|nr:class A beta-lactamase [Phytoactinopolyspora limicola]
MTTRTTLIRRAAVSTLAVAVFAPLVACSTDNGSPATAGPTATSTSTDEPGDPSTAEPTAAPTTDHVVDLEDLTEQFEELEDGYDARLGVYALDTGTGQEITYRPDERFAYASTFKILLCAVVLQQNSVDDLERVITYTEDDLQAHAPVTSEHLDTGLTIRELCDATTKYGDNTAANLLLDEVGGPEGLGDALREIGDDTISVDRYAPELSDAVPGDTRDTTTPRALAASLQTFVLDDTLPEEKRELLVEWLVGNTAADDLIRAGVPDDWTVGDRTGAGGYGTRNCIGVVWPPGRDPIVMVFLSTRETEGAERDDQLIAAAAEVIAEAFEPSATP